MKDNRAKISDARTGGNPEARGGYVSPRVVMVEIKTLAHILQSSTDVFPNNNPWSDGSDSGFNFGDDEL